MSNLKVILKTKFGEHIAEAQIPLFKRGYEPEVVTWGNRTFKFLNYANDSFTKIIYTEVFGYAVIGTPR